MTNKLRQNATASTRGTIYQLGVAVEKCYQLRIDQKLIIEELGDITTDDIQYEIKQYTDSLTDGHHNFWNTVFNWIDEKFDHDQYSFLILHTTQELGKNSQLKSWNNSDTEKRLEILKNINKHHQNKYENKLKENTNAEQPEILKIQNIILKNSEKLLSIIPKIWIEAGSDTLPDLYSKIKEIYIKGILISKKDDFLNSLIGFTCKSDMKKGDRWIISYSDWDKKIGSLLSTYCTGTTVFPKKYFSSKNNYTSPKTDEDLFISKIRDIEYDGDILCDAINAYQSTLDTISNEFRDYSTDPDLLINYSNEVVRSFLANHRIFSRKCREESDEIIESQNLYDSTIREPAVIFPGFNDTPIDFKNGIIHINMNDKDKNHKWRVIKK